MALDFHNKENDDYLFGLADFQMNALHEIFEEFTHWTGQVIDPYADLLMDKNAQVMLLKIIDNYVQKSDLNKDKAKSVEVLGFRGLLKHYMDKNILFQLYGD